MVTQLEGIGFENKIAWQSLTQDNAKCGTSEINEKYLTHSYK